MRLYMTPGSCSTGIHILLEEIDNPFEAAIVNLPAGDQFKPDYVAMNPKSTIPTLLRDDGTARRSFRPSPIGWRGPTPRRSCCRAIPTATRW